MLVALLTLASVAGGAILNNCPLGEYVPDSESCRIFHHCSINTVVKSCGFLMFNPKKQICDWPTNVIQIRPECSNEENMKFNHHTDITKSNSVSRQRFQTLRMIRLLSNPATFRQNAAFRARQNHHTDTFADPPLQPEDEPVVQQVSVLSEPTVHEVSVLSEPTVHEVSVLSEPTVHEASVQAEPIVQEVTEISVPRLQANVKTTNTHNNAGINDDLTEFLRKRISSHVLEAFNSARSKNNEVEVQETNSVEESTREETPIIKSVINTELPTITPEAQPVISPVPVRTPVRPFVPVPQNRPAVVPIVPPSTPLVVPAAVATQPLQPLQPLIRNPVRVRPIRPLPIPQVPASQPVSNPTIFQTQPTIIGQPPVVTLQQVVPVESLPKQLPTQLPAASVSKIQVPATPVSQDKLVSAPISQNQLLVTPVAQSQLSAVPISTNQLSAAPVLKNKLSSVERTVTNSFDGEPFFTTPLFEPFTDVKPVNKEDDLEVDLEDDLDDIEDDVVTTSVQYVEDAVEEYVEENQPFVPTTLPPQTFNLPRILNSRVDLGDLREETRERKMDENGKPLRRIKFSRKIRIPSVLAKQPIRFGATKKPRILRRKFLVNDRNAILERRQQLTELEGTDTRIGVISPVENRIVIKDDNSPIIIRESAPIAPRPQFRNVFQENQLITDLQPVEPVLEVTEAPLPTSVEDIDLRSTEEKQDEDEASSEPAVNQKKGLTLTESIRRTLFPRKPDRFVTRPRPTTRYTNSDSLPNRPSPQSTAEEDDESEKRLNTVYTSSDKLRGSGSPWPFGNQEFWSPPQESQPATQEEEEPENTESTESRLSQQENRFSQQANRLKLLSNRFKQQENRFQQQQARFKQEQLKLRPREEALEDTEQSFEDLEQKFKQNEYRFNQQETQIWSQNAEGKFNVNHGPVQQHFEDDSYNRIADASQEIDSKISPNEQSNILDMIPTVNKQHRVSTTSSVQEVRVVSSQTNPVTECAVLYVACTKRTTEIGSSRCRDEYSVCKNSQNRK